MDVNILGIGFICILFVLALGFTTWVNTRDTQD